MRLPRKNKQFNLNSYSSNDALREKF